MLFPDLSKAFDTVNHEILLLKLCHLGLKMSAVSWFQSYLTNRQQSTKNGSRLSSPKQVSNGIPQGSILGPLLFICYINNLLNCLSNADCFLYADDTAILVKGRSNDEISAKLNREFEKVDHWFSCNKLSVNNSKTKSMLFSSNRFRDRDQPLNVTQNKNDHEDIEQVDKFKYLPLLSNIILVHLAEKLKVGLSF